MAKRKTFRPITKAVIAVAGYGTRFLPATKNQPKEMLPIIDKPIIQYLVEEAVASGIKDIILVTRAGQTALEDYFDSHIELEHILDKNGKKEALELVRRIPRMANFIYVRQKKHLPYGNASPLLAVKSLIAPDEAFVYMFGDDLVRSKVPATKQLMDVFKLHRPAAVLAVQEVPWEEIRLYGSIKYKQNTKINQIEALVEKAERTKAYSNLAVFGRFVFSYKVIEEAQKTPLGRGNELWVADILNRLAQKDVVIAQPIDGKWLTTGDPLHFLKATVEFALERPDLGREFHDYLKTVI
ncbi:MAG: sugar phosphate nucleotidyltransferase [bacterium]|nr:sugar phosphate nucleotidyltransferase [bacterium]